MNRQPFAKPPRRWNDRLNLFWVRLTRRYRSRQLKRLQNIVSVEAENLEVIQQARESGQGTLIVANHSAHYDSNSLYVAADRINSAMYFMTAWQVFGVSTPRQCLAMQMMGCFSVDREGTDRKAFKRACDILRNEPHPLVIFPEGDIYHTTDRVKPFREGAAAIALSAAKRSDRQVIVVPCGIKFTYLDDPTEQLLNVAGQLEERLFLRRAPSDNLTQRIYRIAEALLSLKELDYLGGSRAGNIPDRIKFLANAVLEELEDRHAVNPDGSVPERVKILRQTIIQKIEQLEKKAVQSNGASPKTLAVDLDSLFLVIQLYSYPGDYLLDNPSLERLAETIDKLEEDVLGLEVPTVKGRRRVKIEFGAAVDVHLNGDRRQGTRQLTHRLHENVQQLVDGL